MSTASSREYEFSPSQNEVIGDLARRMGGVGVIFIVVALLNFLVSALIVLAIYRAKLPEDYVKVVLEKASETTRTDLNAQLAKLPLNNQLWGIAISNAVSRCMKLHEVTPTKFVCLAERAYPPDGPSQRNDKPFPAEMRKDGTEGQFAIKLTVIND
jgi:hypothetical protein